MTPARSRPRSHLLLALLVVTFVVVVGAQLLGGGGTPATTPPPELGFEDPLGATPVTTAPATEAPSTTLAPLDPSTRRNPFLPPLGVTTGNEPAAAAQAPPR